MTGPEATSLVIAAIGILLWAWLLKDYPNAVERSTSVRRLQWWLVFFGSVLILVAVRATVTAALNGHSLVLAIGVVLALGQLGFLGIFVQKYWIRRA
jgi:hypothetical protein